MSNFKNHETSNDNQKDVNDSSSIDCSRTDSDQSTCITFVHQNVLIEAIVTIKPRVICVDNPTITCGPSKVEKIKEEEHFHKPKPEHKHPKPPHKELKTEHKFHKKGHDPHDDGCSFVVNQELCLTIPLVFNAEAIIMPGKVACKDVSEGACPCESDNEDEPRT